MRLRGLGLLLPLGAPQLSGDAARLRGDRLELGGVGLFLLAQVVDLDLAGLGAALKEDVVHRRPGRRATPQVGPGESRRLPPPTGSSSRARSNRRDGLGRSFENATVRRSCWTVAQGVGAANRGCWDDLATDSLVGTALRDG